MLATTSSSTGIYKNDRPTPYFRFAVFPSHAGLFQKFAEKRKIEFSTAESLDVPTLIVFQFTCSFIQLTMLVENYQDADYPFGLTNFNLKDEEDFE